ncbi:MAG: TonB-dependent receptor [Tannerella sp.]|nr:TonB-dependent receptor [Tannerella sp.]
MKLSVFFTFLCVAQLYAANTYSQTAAVRLGKSELTLRELIAEVESQTDFLFIFSRDDIDVDRALKVKTGSRRIGDILGDVFLNSDITYKFVEQYITLRKVDGIEPGAVAVAPQQTGRRITGTVVDVAGEAVIGANILEKGTANGIITDVDGRFSLNVSAGAVLQISYIGYIAQEIAVGDRTSLNITLMEDNQALDEVIVVGYGTQRKADLTSSISTLDPAEVLKAPGGIESALQGNVAGVNVSGGKIRIRGTSSITGNTDPLWVVDGIIDGSVPNDDEIESIQILKDAASAAIYGVRGANGVIVVTTKQGKLGQPRISFNSYVGTSSPARKLEMLNPYDYAVYVNELFYNASTEAAKADGSWSQSVPPVNARPGSPMAQTDWWNEYFHSSFFQKYDLSVSGANESADYRLGATYTGDDNSLSRDNRMQNIYANVRGTRGRFTVGGRAQLSYSYNQTTSGASLQRMLYLPPNEPVYDERNRDINGGYYITGTGADGIDITNQAWFVHNERNRTKALNAIGNLFGEIKIFDWLRYRLAYTYSYVSSNSTLFRPAYDIGFGIQNYNYQSTSMNGMQRSMTENLLSFDRTFGAEHTLSGVAGVTSEMFSLYNRGVAGRSQEKTDFGVENVFQDDMTVSGTATDNSYFSWLARVMYTYAGKYMLTANFRADESSKFAAGNRWGYFPSFSAGWRISEEPWMEKATSAGLTNLKLRATLGWIGSAGAVGNYDYQAAVNTVNRMYTLGTSQGTHNAADSNVPAPLPEAIANRDLSWETTRDAGFGLDIAMLNNKLSITFDYYNRHVYDMLLDVQLPSSVGAHPGFGNASVYMNVGSMTNWGIELSATYRDHAGKLGYVISPNFSLYRNRVTDLGNMEYLSGGYVISGAYVTRTAAGESVARFWGLKTDGIFKTDEEAARYVNSEGERYQPSAAAGDIRYVDADSDGKITDDDKMFLGSSIPAISAGLNIGLTYGHFDFSMLLQGDLGISVYNNWRSSLLAGKAPHNQLALMNDRFRGADVRFTTSGGEAVSLPANTGTNIPRAVWGDPNGNSDRASDFFVENASYVRCNNITLGYTLPKRLSTGLQIEHLRFYAGVKNPFTVTGYSMFDPQVPNNGATLDRGVDGMAYYSNDTFWSQREYFAGIQLTF